MKQVSKDEFFAVMNPLNVHPRVDVSTLRGDKPVSNWEMLDGTRRLVGISKGNGDAAEYFLVGS